MARGTGRPLMGAATAALALAMLVAALPLAQGALRSSLFSCSWFSTCDKCVTKRSFFAGFGTCVFDAKQGRCLSSEDSSLSSPDWIIPHHHGASKLCPLTSDFELLEHRERIMPKELVFKFSTGHWCSRDCVDVVAPFYDALDVPRRQEIVKQCEKAPDDGACGFFKKLIPLTVRDANGQTAQPESKCLATTMTTEDHTDRFFDSLVFKLPNTMNVTDLYLLDTPTGVTDPSQQPGSTLISLEHNAASFDHLPPKLLRVKVNEDGAVIDFNIDQVLRVYVHRKSFTDGQRFGDYGYQAIAPGANYDKDALRVVWVIGLLLRANAANLAQPEHWLLLRTGFFMQRICYPATLNWKI